MAARRLAPERRDAMAHTHTLVSPRSQPSRYAEFVTSLLSDRERFFAEIADGEDLARKLRFSFGTMVALSAAYGAAAGAYSGPLQAASAAIKLPVLFLATLLICFPAFFVVQVLVGSRLRLVQVLTLACGALALTATLLAAAIPVLAKRRQCRQDCRNFTRFYRYCRR